MINQGCFRKGGCLGEVFLPHSHPDFHTCHTCVSESPRLQRAWWTSEGTPWMSRTAPWKSKAVCICISFSSTYVLGLLVIIWHLFQSIYHFLDIVFNYHKDKRFSIPLCKFHCHDRDSERGRDRDSVKKVLHSNIIRRVCLLCWNIRKQTHPIPVHSERRAKNTGTQFSHNMLHHTWVAALLGPWAVGVKLISHQELSFASQLFLHLGNFLNLKSIQRPHWWFSVESFYVRDESCIPNT